MATSLTTNLSLEQVAEDSPRSPTMPDLVSSSEEELAVQKQAEEEEATKEQVEKTLRLITLSVVAPPLLVVEGVSAKQKVI